MKIKKKQIFLVLLVLITVLVCAIYLYYITNITQTRSSSPNIVASSKNSSPKKTPQASLSQSDELARENILNKYLNGTNQSGIVYKSTSVQVEYIADANIFQAEILTKNVYAAKVETEYWFHKQGLSQAGLCKLPLIFYLSLPVKESLPTNGSNVNLLPDGC